jgi:hypothetical protein
MKVSASRDPIVLMVGRGAIRGVTCVLILKLVLVWSHSILYEKSLRPSGAFMRGQYSPSPSQERTEHTAARHSKHYSYELDRWHMAPACHNAGPGHSGAAWAHSIEGCSWNSTREVRP